MAKCGAHTGDGNEKGMGRHGGAARGADEATAVRLDPRAREVRDTHHRPPHSHTYTCLPCAPAAPPLQHGTVTHEPKGT
jgi:hypothetical protein